MRIVHIGELELERDTGSGQAVMGLSRALQAVGVENQILSLSSRSQLGRITLGGLLSWSKVDAYREADVLHLHGAFVLRLRIVAHRARRPYVITPHGGYEPMVFQRSRTLLKRAYFRAWERKFLEDAGCLIALSEAEADNLSDLTSAPVSVLPNALDFAVPDQVFHLRSNGSESKASQCGPIVFLGRGDTFNKGLDRLGLIARMLPHETFRAHIAGTFDHRGTDVAPNLRFVPAVYGTDKVRSLSEAKAYIQLSRWEAFGMSIAEAAGSGLPIILSPENNLAPALEEAEACYIVVPEDPMSVEELGDLLDDPQRLEELGRQARAWAHDHLDLKTVGERARSIYARVLGTGGAT